MAQPDRKRKRHVFGAAAFRQINLPTEVPERRTPVKPATHERVQSSMAVDENDPELDHTEEDPARLQFNSAMGLQNRSLVYIYPECLREEIVSVGSSFEWMGRTFRQLEQEDAAESKKKEKLDAALRAHEEKQAERTAKRKNLLYKAAAAFSTNDSVLEKLSTVRDDPDYELCRKEYKEVMAELDETLFRNVEAEIEKLMGRHK